MEFNCKTNNFNWKWDKYYTKVMNSTTNKMTLIAKVTNSITKTCITPNVVVMMLSCKLYTGEIGAAQSMRLNCGKV